jgi:4-hydroxythreonine-4-phosphate dehydrogenase
MINAKPRIALVLGDPCGIGPELAVKLLADPETLKQADIIVVSGQNVFEDGLKAAGVEVAYRLVDDATTPSTGEKLPLLLSSPAISRQDYKLTEVSKKSGEYQLNCLAKALDLCRNGHADAICFAPLNKEAMHLAGLEHEDESGFFIDQLGHQGDFGLLNTLGNLWTSRATSHVAHRQVSELLTRESILEATRLLHDALLASGNKNPKIAVAGLNPHAGDGGMFGTEEIDIIEPAVNQARAEGINAFGPFPPDTIFLQGRDGIYDAIVTMYHDQGQIAMKLMGFDRGVTLHAGLPFPITTSAHGSAMDIAGQGIANVNALRQAFLLARSMAL